MYTHMYTDDLEASDHRAERQGYHSTPTNIFLGWMQNEGPWTKLLLKSGKEKFLLFPCCCSVAQSRLTLCNLTDCSTPGFPILHYLLEFAQTHVHGVNDALRPSHSCHPRLLLPSVFPSIRVFSSELALCIRWPKDWSSSFSFPSPFINQLCGIRPGSLSFSFFVYKMLEKGSSL